MGYYLIMSSGELYHHGILGQKWGQRNGPPYPLGSGDHSAREEKAGWKKSLTKKAVKRAVNDRIVKNEPEKKSLTDRQKKILKIGATIAVAGLATYGVYKISKLPALNKNAIPVIDDVMKQTLSSTEFKEMSSFDPKLDFQFIPNDRDNALDYLSDISTNRVNPVLRTVLGKEDVKDILYTQLCEVDDAYKDKAIQHVLNEQSIEKWGSRALEKLQDPEYAFDVLRDSINPDYVSALDSTGYVGTSKGLRNDLALLSALDKVDSNRTTNCMYCTTAFDLNKRGFKVKANGRSDGGLLTELFDMYKLKDDSLMYFKGQALNANTISEKLSSYDNGKYARGNMIVTFKGGGGHSVAWEMVNNSLSIMDFQTGTKYEGAALDKFIKSISDCNTVRTDNAELIWNDQLLRAIDFMD